MINNKIYYFKDEYYRGITISCKEFVNLILSSIKSLEDDEDTDFHLLNKESNYYISSESTYNLEKHILLLKN